MVEELGAKVDEVKELTYRGNGWPDYASIIKNDGSTSVKNINRLLMMMRNHV